MRILHSFVTLALVLILVAGCSIGPTPEKPVAQAAVQPTATISTVPRASASLTVEAPEQPTERPTGQPTVPPPAETGPMPTEQPTSRQPAPAVAPETVAGERSVADIVAGLQGLSIDDFFEESYKQLLLRNPEQLTVMGMAEAYGLRNDQLNNLSDAYIRETQQLEAAILDLLRTYNRAMLTAEQQVSYDVYDWYLDDLVRGHEFMYYDYPVHHFLGSYDDELVRLLTELHPFRNRQDAEDYVARLSQIDDQVDQLLEGLKLREEAGVIPPRFIVGMTLRNLRSTVYSSARSTPFYTAFAEKVGSLEGASDADRQALTEAVEKEIAGSVIPAFAKLVEYFEVLETIATDNAGVWKFPNGDAYYAYILRDQASVDSTPEEVHELGLAEVERIQAEMRQVFDELGYPQGAGLGELMDRAIEEGGFYDIRTQAGKDQLIAAYETMLEEIDRRLDAVVDIRPKAEVAVVGGPMGGYYVAGTADGSRPGAFHVGIEGSWAPKFNMPTVAYHEAIPGHHFQIAIAQEADLPLFRNDIFFNGFGEGWALYAERLAWELGLYDDDPYGNLGRLQLELLRAVRLVTDTGIHAQRWTREEAKAYMREALGDPAGRWAHEVERYIVLPAQATGYKIGMLKILELRQKAMDALGDQFDIKEFHNVLVGDGSMPLDILERAVQESIDAKLGAVDAVPAGDGVVQGWAVLAEKDDYGDVDMTDLPVGHIGVTQMRHTLEESGWEAGQIRELREFNRETLQQHLDWLAENADEDDIVFLYVAAHGGYLRDVLGWDAFFAGEWQQVPSHRRLLLVDSCQAANYTGVVSDDPAPYLSIAAVAGDEYAWSGLEEEGLPIIGGVFTHYFAAAFDDADADADGDGWVSVQEAAVLAEDQQRTYMHEVVLAVPEFAEMYHEIGVYPDQDPTFPDVIVDDTVGEALYLDLEAYP